MRNPFLYDMVMAPFERLVLAPWRREVFAQARGRVLEIGAGTGYALRHYVSPEQVVLVDRRHAMLRRAAWRAKRAGFLVSMLAGEAERLPFPDGMFDTVTVSLAMCTVTDPLAAFAEIARVLAPEGRLLLLEHVRVDQPRVAALQDRLTPAWRAVSGGCHLNRRTLDTALSVGFEPVTVRLGGGGWLLAACLRKRAAGA